MARATTKGATTMKSTVEKLYPFSTAKHAHDIEYYVNTLWNKVYDLDDNDEEYYKLMKEIVKVNELRTIMSGACGRPVWFTGKQIAFAKQICGWASGRRAEVNAFRA